MDFYEFQNILENQTTKAAFLFFLMAKYLHERIISIAIEKNEIVRLFYILLFFTICDIAR